MLVSEVQHNFNMSDTDDDKCTKKSTFLDASVDKVFKNCDDEECDLIDHFGTLPKEQRSHEDFDSLVELVRVIWHNKLWLEHELELKTVMYEQSVNANLELKNLCNRVGNLLVRQDGNKIRLNKVVEDIRKEFYFHVVDVCLNGHIYTVNRKHMRHLLQWYAYDPSIYFVVGDTYVHTSEDVEYRHKFGLGEIVEWTCTDGKGEVTTQEVILFRECPYIIDVVTAKELQRCDPEEDIVCKPRFVYSKDVKPCSPRRYLMEKKDMIDTINDIFNL